MLFHIRENRRVALDANRSANRSASRWNVPVRLTLADDAVDPATGQWVRARALTARHRSCADAKLHALAEGLAAEGLAAEGLARVSAAETARSPSTAQPRGVPVLS